MSKKRFALMSLILVLGLVSNASAELVGQWKLDDGGGTNVLDASGNGNNGTLEDDPVVVDGQFGQALEFDNSRVAIAASDTLTADLFQGSFTLSGWINPTRTGNTWQQIFRAWMETGGSNDTLFINNDGRLSWRGRVGGGWAGGMCETAADVAPAGQWTHFAVTGDGTNFRIYVNGELSQESAFQTTDGTNANYYIGGNPNGAGEAYTGMVDDLRVYDHVLSEDDIRGSMENQGGAIVKAYGPDPRNGAMLEATWVTLSWRAGDLAVSHDVYLGDNFDDVNDGAAGAFQGNQVATMLIAGFAGFPYPEGLVPGTTYYWRIDEVNPDEPNSPWRGDIWSFTLPPKTAYEPVPADGARFIEPEPTLGWTPGYGSKLHTVYFGDDYDTVANAAGGLPQANATFTPAGPLEPEKTYYWRVDEFDVVATHQGEVWSFEVAKEGGGIKGEYFQGMTPGGIPVLTRTDPQIDFSWGNNAPDPLVGEDNFSCRWTGQVEAVFSETYTFYTNSDDGVRLWVDGKRLINNWTNHGNTEDKGKIDLVAGQTYSVVMELYEDGGGAVAQLRWESPSTPKQLIPAAALSYLVSANNPGPANGTNGVKLVTDLTWNPGEFAASHEVYFGADADAVAGATKASPEYKGSKQLGDESFDPGKLAWDTDYFWRVDEVNATNPDSPWVGNVWTFDTGDFLVVDDFESYNDIDPPDEASNRIFDKWIDGFGTTTNGALVGNDLPPYAEQTIVSGGAQSMIYRYDNANKTSEAALTLVWPRDWTEEGVARLSLWHRGQAGNAPERMFVALNGNAVVYHEDAAVTQTSRWTEWVVDLTSFAGVDLTNVNTITIGVGTKGSPAAGGSGQMYFDDIRLYR